MSAVVFASEVRDGVRHVSLNRPEKRNALNRELITALSEQLRQAADDDATEQEEVPPGDGDHNKKKKKKKKGGKGESKGENTTAE